VKRPQIQCLSPQGEFWERNSAPALFAVKRTVEWSKIFFSKRKGIWTTIQQDATAYPSPRFRSFFSDLFKKNFLQKKDWHKKDWQPCCDAV